MAAFDIDSFIAGINQDKTQSRDNTKRLNRVLMNTRDTQGTVQFLPILSKQSGNFYLKIPRVYEYYGDTSLIDSGEAWYKVLPLECYPNLTQSQIELYNEVKGYLDKLNDDEEVSYDEFRIRNYALFNGICSSLKNSEGKEVDKYTNCPCIFVYPSNAVIDALGTAINAKIDVMKGKKDWIPMVLSPSNTGRQGVVMITYLKKPAAVGYDATVNFEFNSPMNMVIDPDYVIPDETMNLFDDVMPTFLGWIYDMANKSYFNEIAFKELRDQLKLRIKDINQGTTNAVPADDSKVYENQNDLSQPATPTAAPTEVKKSTPF